MPQPITVRPELTQFGGKPMVFVATGKLLGASDTTDVQGQSIYGIVDPVTGSTAFPDLRTALAPLAMTQTGVFPAATRSVTCTGTAAQCGSADGWYVDLRDTGERVNVEMKLRGATLVVGSNVPQIGPCITGWLQLAELLRLQERPCGAGRSCEPCLRLGGQGAHRRPDRHQGGWPDEGDRDNVSTAARSPGRSTRTSSRARPSASAGARSPGDLRRRGSGRAAGPRQAPMASSISVSICSCILFCCSAGPSIRKVSSTRSPSVVILASCRLMLCCASTREIA